MQTVFVGWQDPDTREWIPVARLRRDTDVYLLDYTAGAKRAREFNGFARMNDLGATYSSKELFPFFANRLLSPARADYPQYSRWLAIDGEPYDPLKVLALTGGARATDSFEIIPAPQRQNGRLELDFFVRGLKYSSASSVGYASDLPAGTKLFVMRDVQNPVDPQALCLRTEGPYVFVGYVPRYYSAGLSRLLNETGDVVISVRRANSGAPFDLRLLCRLDALWPSGFHLLESNRDFLKWTDSPYLAV